QEESARLERAAQKEAQEALQTLRSKQEASFQSMLQTANEERRRNSETLRKHEEDTRRKLEEERRKKIEARRREAQELKRKAEEERKRQEDLARQKAEAAERKRQEEEERRRQEEARLKAEEERRQQEEHLRREGEERQRKAEEEQKRQELIQQRRAEEQRQMEEEKQERLQTLLSNAKGFFASNDYEHALVEVAKALVNDPINPEALELEAKIKELQVTTPAPAAKEKPKSKKKRPMKVMGQEPLPKKPLSRQVLIGILTGVLLVGGVIIYQVKKNVFTAPSSFAILPWTSGNNTLEEKILGSSLAEEVAERFDLLKSVNLLGFGSSYGLAKHTLVPATGVYELGYFYTLHGTISRSGETVHVTVKLVDSMGNTAASYQYQKTTASLGELPIQIAKQLSDFLSVPSKEIPSAFTEQGPPTNNPDAYLFYLRGKELLHRRTAESFQNAYLLFMQAVQQDPKFADAQAAAANVLATAFELGWNTSDSVLTQARHLAEAAMSINPSSPNGYHALGKTLALSKEYREALAQLGSAVRLAPHFGEAYVEEGKLYLKIGRVTEGINALNQAFKLNPRDAEVLKTLALAFEFTRMPRQSMWYHETVLYFIDDSLAYIAGPVADAITFDPDLRFSQGNRVIAACERNIASNPKDYFSMYQLARLLPVMGKYAEGKERLRTLEALLQNEVRLHPKDTRALVYLALTLTRFGKFADATLYARKAIDLEPKNADVIYKIAQVYSLQMYSQKKKEIDPKKKEAALKTLRQAIRINYRLDQLTNADFYNMFDQPEFQSLIQEPLE
ncbi:MAG: hypothetical protein HY277_05335, partial [Ignavibacteriales bacterium]|nr:hypothetical protein [Ignavibacteriales bacterium]